MRYINRHYDIDIFVILTSDIAQIGEITFVVTFAHKSTIII